MRASRVAVLLLALASLSPAAFGWGGGPGSAEPSTPQDRTGPMWQTAPPAGATMRLYFDAFPSLDGTVVNPNSATLGTRLVAPGPDSFNALLGAWVDCNGDGYVGTAEGALMDYPAQLVTDHVACPIGGPHNDGQWATELLMIGSVDPCEYQYDAATCPAQSSLGATLAPTPGDHAYYGDPVALYAQGVRIWGDFGAPADAPPANCPAAPLPRGATSSVGGLLRVVDCEDGGDARATLDALAPEAGPTLDAAFLVTAFGDPVSGQAGLAQEGSGDPAATLWDCSRPTALGVGDPTGGAIESTTLQDPSGGELSGPQPTPVVGPTEVFDGNGDWRPAPGNAQGQLVWAPEPSPQVHDARGSYWDAAEYALDGPHGDCDASTASPASSFYVGRDVEGQVGFGGGDRATNDVVFQFDEGYRGLDPSVDPILESGRFPSDFGTPYLRNQYGGPIWTSLHAPVVNPPLLRRDLTLTGSTWFSFYAAIDMPGYQLPNGAGTYGAEACEGSVGAGAPNDHGWTCDPALWWKDLGGHDDMPRYTDGNPLGAAPGDSYQLRDVDCYDDGLGFCPS
ncbi:MAG: hypothetical protein QOE90_158 [Thermoplasmata archaeon]|jgi:hypothetical protein|nr:hypothetical protein [Thermoplasmata archaeon]